MTESRLRRLWRGLRFRDALLATFLPVLALGLILAGSVRDSLRALQYDDWWGRAQSVQTQFSARVRAIAGLPKSLTLRDSFSPEDRDAGIIRLEVPAARWDSLELEADGQWAPWLDGDLRYGGTTLPVRLRKRGDNSVHWLTDKRTLTVRTPRDAFYKSFRSFGLSAKDVFSSYLANRVAQEFGLLAPATAVSPVYLNNRFVGIFRVIEVVDESFLRPLDRMPGNIFRGDAAERGEYHKGTHRNLFANPRLWARASANDRWTSAGSGQLRLLLQDVAGTTFDDHLRMMRRLDRGEYGRLFAYLLLMGDPYHIDGVHNELLYEDPSTQKLHPIPWDTRLLSLSQSAFRLNDLFRAVLNDPFVLDSTMGEVARRLAGDAFLGVADSLVRSAASRYEAYFEYDKLRAGLVPNVGDSTTILRILRGNAALLRRWLAEDEVAFAATPAGPATVLDFETRGRVGADLTALTLDRPVAGPLTLRLDANLNGALDPSDPPVALRADAGSSGTRFVVARPVALLPGWNPDSTSILPGHLPYRLFLSGVPAGAGVTPVLANRATGTPVTPSALERGAPVREGTAWHPWRFPAAPYRLHRLSGTVRLAENLRIPYGDTLLIEPGTTIRLAPDVSIVSEGRVLARGTAQRPIHIVPDQAGIPWGSFAVQGHGADSSQFSHVEFTQGGGALIDRVEYTGMVNVHRADGVVFERVTFRENLRSDDALHALHASIRVHRSHFVGSNADAIDMDVSTGDIVDNVIEGSGNDGLDLMSAAPVISGNRIVRSGDKGISIGESSRPFVFNNLIDSCNIGIETKDRSDPIVLNNVVTNSRTGLRERRKNWRYGGGGWPVIAATEFQGNRTPWIRDAYSRITLQDVVGLDSAEAGGADQQEDITWLYRLTGIAPPRSRAPGLVGRWTATAPVRPVDQQTFVDDFGPVSDGWLPAGGVDRLEKRREALVIEAELHPGTASRAVQWRLPQGGTLVVELSARDFAAARIVVSGPGRPLSRPVHPANDLASARFFTLPLPPGDYNRLAIELDPVPGLMRTDSTSGLSVPRSARLDLRSYRLLPSLDPAGLPGGSR